MAKSKNNIKVCCRFRILNKREKKRDGDKITFGLTEATVTDPETGGSFNFDRVFLPLSTQEEVYHETAEPTIKDVLSGYNGTIFAYGQTGSGKTHTMFGHGTQLGFGDGDNAGIVPRSAGAIFQSIGESEEGIQFMIKCSYLEIYNETIRDLLTKADSLKVRESPQQGVFVAGLAEECVTAPQEMLDLLKIGGRNRHVAKTGMNERSSRSHTLFVTAIYQRNLDGSEKVGKLNFIDLAGSERVQKTNASGSVLEEAKKINQSLSALGNCVNALVDGHSHVPFRDSKLTRILQESLGGNCRTTLVLACSPASSNYEETLGTLKFGQRAKSIENKAKVNAQRSAMELNKLVATLTAEVARLKKELSNSVPAGGSPTSALVPKGVDEADTEADEETLLEMAEKQLKLSNKNDELEAKVRDLEAELRESQAEMHALNDSCTHFETLLMETQTKLQSNRDAHEAEAARLQYELELKTAECQGRDSGLEGATQLLQRQLQEMHERLASSNATAAQLRTVIDGKEKELTLVSKELEEVKQEKSELEVSRYQTQNRIARAVQNHTTGTIGVLNNFRYIGAGQLSLMKTTVMERGGFDDDNGTADSGSGSPSPASPLSASFKRRGRSHSAYNLQMSNGSSGLAAPSPRSSAVDMDVPDASLGGLHGEAQSGEEGAEEKTLPGFRKDDDDDDDDTFNIDDIANELEGETCESATTDPSAMNGGGGRRGAAGGLIGDGVENSRAGNVSAPSLVVGLSDATNMPRGENGLAEDVAGASGEHENAKSVSPPPVGTSPRATSPTQLKGGKSADWWAKRQTASGGMHSLSVPRVKSRHKSADLSSCPEDSDIVVPQNGKARSPRRLQRLDSVWSKGGFKNLKARPKPSTKPATLSHTHSAPLGPHGSNADTGTDGSFVEEGGEEIGEDGNRKVPRPSTRSANAMLGGSRSAADAEHVRYPSPSVAAEEGSGRESPNDEDSGLNVAREARLAVLEDRLSSLLDQLEAERTMRETLEATLRELRGGHAESTGVLFRSQGQGVIGTSSSKGTSKQPKPVSLFDRIFLGCTPFSVDDCAEDESDSDSEAK